MPKWLIYGANGYTGRLMAEKAVSEGMTPILAGRSESVRELANSLGLPCRVFPLDKTHLKDNLADVDLALNCAGPFSRTAEEFMQGCLVSSCHYMDITGEIDVIEKAFSRSKSFEREGLLAIPAVGFDVVPTDCLAASLSKELPDAQELELAFRTNGQSSPGTLKSALEGLKRGNAQRSQGSVQWFPFRGEGKEIAFLGRKSFCMQIPWGDVSSAFYSTGISNIKVYTEVPPIARYVTRALFFALQLPMVENILKKLTELTVSGPDEKERARPRVNVWGQVRNGKGKAVSGEIETPEGYEFTARSCLRAVERFFEILEKEPHRVRGVQTPSLFFGADFVFSIEGVRWVLKPAVSTSD